MAEGAARWAPRLIVLSDFGRLGLERTLERFSALAFAATPGSVLILLRDYELPLATRLRISERLSVLTARAEQTFGLAERADLARAVGARALHLPGSGISARDARAYLGEAVFLSRGYHAPETEPEPEPEPDLDACLLSPIFEPRKGRPALGVAALERTALLPGARPALFALGGVEAHNAAACLSAGAAGVAVIGAALRPDPEPLLRALGIRRI